MPTFSGQDHWAERIWCRVLDSEVPVLVDFVADLSLGKTMTIPFLMVSSQQCQVLRCISSNNSCATQRMMNYIRNECSRGEFKREQMKMLLFLSIVIFTLFLCKGLGGVILLRNNNSKSHLKVLVLLLFKILIHYKTC